MTFFALAVFLLALGPALLWAKNIREYRPLPNAPRGCPRVSILIPARNEERRIRGALKSALASRNVDLEVIVLDDHSTDATASIVREMMRHDSRVRLVNAPGLPAGWCGKQHACYQAAKAARYPVLIFTDADVRLAPHAAAGMAEFLRASGAALISGVPRQGMETFSERLLIPLIHFILLSFLPLKRMRTSTDPAYGAGCGQLFAAQREAYFQAGGHAALRTSLHDGLQLPRAFRRAGFATDLFDATDAAECRMYETNGEVWPGLAKNATEGFGSPRLILPATIMLVLGQIMPWVVVFVSRVHSTEFLLGISALGLSLAPRLASAVQFQQRVWDTLWHPLGVASFLAIQWWALARRWLGYSPSWKNRAYPEIAVPVNDCGELAFPLSPNPQSLKR